MVLSTILGLNFIACDQNTEFTAQDESVGAIEEKASETDSNTEFEQEVSNNYSQASINIIPNPNCRLNACEKENPIPPEKDWCAMGYKRCPKNRGEK